MLHDDEKKNFVKYHNSKFVYRRGIAIAAFVAYIALSFYMVWHIPADNFDKYDSFFMMFTSFATGIVVTYFGGASYEAVRQDSSSMIDEYQRLQDRNNRNRRRNRRSSQNTDDDSDPSDDSSIVDPDAPRPPNQQSDNEVG